MRDRLQSTECARFLKALADPLRLKIIQCLQARPQNVSELSTTLEQEIANVSHHLAVLRHARLVQDQKHGKFVVYCLHPDIARTAAVSETAGCLDLGCCRLEWGEH